MAAESEEPGQEHLDSLIDDLIREILDAHGAPSAGGRAGAAALLETAAAAPRAASRPAVLERLLLANVIASELADALAPALAEVLAPKVLRALERSDPGRQAHKGPADTAKSGGSGRKPGPAR